MQLKSALLLLGCAWVVAAPAAAAVSGPQHRTEHAAHGAKHRRTDLKEVPEEHSEVVPQDGKLPEPSMPESSHHCWHEGTAEEENKFTELGPHSQHTVCSYHNLYLWNGQASPIHCLLIPERNAFPLPPFPPPLANKTTIYPNLNLSVPQSCLLWQLDEASCGAHPQMPQNLSMTRESRQVSCSIAMSHIVAAETKACLCQCQNPS